MTQIIMFEMKDNHSTVDSRFFSDTDISMYPPGSKVTLRRINFPIFSLLLNSGYFKLLVYD